MKISTNAWDKRFKKEGRVFEEPHEDLPGIVNLLKEKGARTVLDLGSGTGRHLVVLAKSGFSVFGLDNSRTGIRMAKNWLKSEGVTADLHRQEMTKEFPYADSFFDAVLSIQVIHHAEVAAIKRTIKEIERVLKKGGFIFITVPNERTQGKEFAQIEPDTFIPLDGPEKGLPHHYFTTGELKRFFRNFLITDLHLDSNDHYCLSGFKQ